MSVDPGETVGIAAVAVTDDGAEKIHSSEVEAGYTRSEVEWLLARAPLGVERILSVEKYISAGGPQTHQPRAQQLVGVILDIGERFKVEVVVQSPGDIKKIGTNKLLKEVGWWHKGGEGHANDALRQCARVVALRRASSYGKLRRPDKIDQTDR